MKTTKKPVAKKVVTKKPLPKANNGKTVVPTGTRVSDGRIWNNETKSYSSDAETLRMQQAKTTPTPTGVPTGTVVSDGRIWNNETKSYSPAPLKRGGAIKKKMTKTSLTKKRGGGKVATVATSKLYKKK
jgi:hypothetical protein